MADKSCYEGEFRNNKMEGHGVYKWPEGSQYEGIFENNRMHGQGKFINKDGRVYGDEEDDYYYEYDNESIGLAGWARAGQVSVLFPVSQLSVREQPAPVGLDHPLWADSGRHLVQQPLQESEELPLCSQVGLPPVQCPEVSRLD